MTEKGVASSDATNIGTSIRQEGDEIVINGHKWSVILNAVTQGSEMTSNIHSQVDFWSTRRSMQGSPCRWQV